jgi:hypothetical protein
MTPGRRASSAIPPPLFRQGRRLPREGLWLAGRPVIGEHLLRLGATREKPTSLPRTALHPYNGLGRLGAIGCPEIRPVARVTWKWACQGPANSVPERGVEARRPTALQGGWQWLPRSTLSTARPAGRRPAGCAHRTTADGAPYVSTGDRLPGARSAPPGSPPVTGPRATRPTAAVRWRDSSSRGPVGREGDQSSVSVSGRADPDRRPAPAAPPPSSSPRC